MNKKKLLLLLLLLLLLVAAVVVALLLTAGEPAAAEPEETPAAETTAAEEATEEEMADKAEETVEKVYSTEIKDIFKHCVDVQEVPEGYYPTRFSEKRLEDYKGYPVMPYAGCSAGITMEFITDAPVISFTFELLKNVWGSGFDILENGEFTEFVEVGSNKWGMVEYERRVKDGPSEITICLPVASDTAVSDLDLGNFKTDITDDRPKLLVLGDSISQGLFGSTPMANWPFLLAQKQGLDYLNLSVGGETFRRAALDKNIGFAPDHIIVALGTNDLFQTRYINAIGKDAADYFERLHDIYPEVSVTVITPFGFLGMNESSNMFNTEQLEAADAVIAAAAAEYGYAMIDGRELISASAEYYAPNDSVHFSSKGFELVAENLDKLLTIGK